MHDYGGCNCPTALLCTDVKFKTGYQDWYTVQVQYGRKSDYLGKYLTDLGHLDSDTGLLADGI